MWHTVVLLADLQPMFVALDLHHQIAPPRAGHRLPRLAPDGEAAPLALLRDGAQQAKGTLPHCRLQQQPVLAILAEGQVRITQTDGTKVIASAQDGFLSMEGSELTIVAGHAALES